FIAYPLWVTSNDAAILTRIADDGVLAVGTDSVAAVHQLANATGSPPGIEIMIEVNSGTTGPGSLPIRCYPLLEPVATQPWSCAGVLPSRGTATHPTGRRLQQIRKP